MNWKRFAPSTRQPAPVRFRPRLDPLEDRTVLSPVVFGIDPSSTLSLSGTVGGSAIQQQGPGSLTTTYQGAVSTDVDFDNGVVTFINDGNVAVADNSGNWQPRSGGGSGSEPANYGGRATVVFVTANAAVRNLAVFASTDNPEPLNPVDVGVYQFDSTQNLGIATGNADYNAGSFGSGSADLSNLNAQNNAAPGTLTDNGDGTLTIIVPVNVTINQSIGGIQATLHITGTITAYGSFGGAPHGGHSGGAALGIALEAGAHAQLTPTALETDALVPALAPAPGDLTVTPSQSQGVRADGTAVPPLLHPAMSRLAAVDAAFLDVDRIEGGSL